MGIAIVILKFHVESWITYICYKRPMGINSHPRILIVWQPDIITHKRKDIYIGPGGKSDWFKVLCSITFFKRSGFYGSGWWPIGLCPMYLIF